MTHRARMVPNPPTPNRAIAFDADVCIGCNQCVEICRSDVMMPNPQKGQPPLVLYPDECWYCGCCVLECKFPGAIAMLHPLNQSVSVVWKDAATGEHSRLGMIDPPPPNTRPPAK